MADDDLLNARADWRQQNAAFRDTYANLRRHRWRPHLVLALELTSAIISMLVGVWFGYMAVKLSSLLYALSAIMMLLATPSLTVAAVLARRDSLRWDEETPEGVLMAGLRRTNASLRAIHVGRWHAVVIAVFVTILWVTQAAGLIQARNFLILYTLICMATLIPYLAWLRWRERRVIKERASYQCLLHELSELT